MTLSDLSIKRPVLAWMLMLGLIIFGGISFSRLGISQMPDVDFPQLSIRASWEGAAPDIMESEIADRIEEEVISVEGIIDMETSVRQGSASINLYFEIGRDVDVALQEVQAKLTGIRFPLNVDPPTISKSNPDDSPIMFVGVASETRSLRDLVIYVENSILDQIQVVPGVGEIFVAGDVDRNLRVWLDNEKLRKYELTVVDVQRAIQTEHTEIAGGFLETPTKEFNVRTLGEGRTAEEVSNLLITQRGGRTIYDSNIRIKDVARVEDGLAEVRRLSRVNGIPGVGLGIRKIRGANAVEVADLVKQRIEEMRKFLPEDIRIQVNFDRTIFIREAVHETEFTLLLSAVITALVCWFFLGSWSSTFNVLLSIPTSIIGAFMIIYFCGFTLNFFTLLALGLAVGIVVDDAIMVLENIVRHHEMGKHRVRASLEGAREITFAAVAASVAVIAIFVPIIFMKGTMGMFLYQFGVTLSAAVALSLLEAITLTPMRCSRFLRHADEENWLVKRSNSFFNRLGSLYRSTLQKSLRHHWFVLGGATLFFLASLIVFKFISFELVPPQDMGVFMIRMQTPVGSSLEFTNERVKEVEELIKARPEVDKYFLSVGGFGGGGEVNAANIFVTMKPYPGSITKIRHGFMRMLHRLAGKEYQDGYGLRQFALMDHFRQEAKKIKGITRFVPTDQSTQGLTPRGGRGSQPVDFNLRGPDYGVLKEKSVELMQKLEDTKLVVDMDSDYREGQPEIQITPNREKAAGSGVPMDVIGDTINIAVGGARYGKFTQGGRRYDVRLRLEQEYRQSPEMIKNVMVRTQYGELLPLGSLVEIETVPTLQSITRRMRQRSISITGNLAPGISQAEALDAVSRISKEVLPEGYQIYFSGTSQLLSESWGEFLMVLGMGVIVAYMVLASQFNSFIHPFTVLLALPFSLSGALLALQLGGFSLNLYSGIGIILLMGIVKKNSILLVEFTNVKRYQDKMPLIDAILTAAPIRLRPILMTSCATVAAALPPALALGPGAESRIPMAVAVIGGVVVSTLLTLFVVPCAYKFLAQFEKNHEAQMEVEAVVEQERRESEQRSALATMGK
jgi:hydrophobe/amphiphile efflux-1 (HAE1) family protein